MRKLVVYKTDGNVHTNIKGIIAPKYAPEKAERLHKTKGMFIHHFVNKQNKINTIKIHEIYRR